MKTSAKSPTAANDLESMIQQTLNDSDYSRQSHRLIRTGRVSDTTTFGDLDHILAVDEVEQRLARDLSDWFDLYDLEKHTASEANVALALVLLDLALDPDDDGSPAA